MKKHVLITFLITIAISPASVLAMLTEYEYNQSMKNKNWHINIQYQCPNCKNYLTSHENLVLHIKRKHSAENHIACFNQTCSKIFLTLNELKEHISENHVQERHFVCLECGKELKVKKNLTDHILSHHNKISRVCCYFCDRKFKNPESLRVHIKQTHGLNMKQVKKLLEESKNNKEEEKLEDFAKLSPHGTEILIPSDEDLYCYEN